VYILKFLLLLLSFFIFFTLLYFIDSLYNNIELYLYAFGYVIGQALIPVWYFSGKQNMKLITYLNISAKIFFTVLIFIFIKTESDYLNVVILNSLGYILVGVIGFYLVKKNINFKLPTRKYFITMFYESFSLFISNLSVSLYTASNILILGTLTNNTIVGIFSSIEKIITAFKTLYIPLYQALYPWISRKKPNNIRIIISKLIVPIIFTALIIQMGLILFSDNILSILYNNKDLNTYSYLLVYMSIIPLFSSLNMLFNMLYLTSINMNRIRMKILISAGIISILMSSILTYVFKLDGMIASTILIELYLLVAGAHYYNKLSL
jgi:PST family polysaccharide transporter